MAVSGTRSNERFLTLKESSWNVLNQMVVHCQICGRPCGVEYTKQGFFCGIFFWLWDQFYKCWMIITCLFSTCMKCMPSSFHGKLQTGCCCRGCSRFGLEYCKQVMHEETWVWYLLIHLWPKNCILSTFLTGYYSLVWRMELV